MKKVVKRYKLKKEVKERLRIVLMFIALIMIVAIIGYVERYVNF